MAVVWMTEQYPDFKISVKGNVILRLSSLKSKIIKCEIRIRIGQFSVPLELQSQLESRVMCADILL